MRVCLSVSMCVFVDELEHEDGRHAGAGVSLCVCTCV